MVCVRALQEEEAVEAAAQDAVTSELQKRAAARAAWQSAARRSALDWLRHPVPAVTVNFVNEWLAVLHDALAALHPPTAVPGADAHSSNGAAATGAVMLPGAPPEEQGVAVPPVPPGTAPDQVLDPALASIADGYPSDDDGAGSRAAAAEAPPPTGAGVLALTNGAPDRAATAEPGENGSALAVRPRRRADAAALTEALDAIRELTSLHVTLPLLASTEILPTLKRLTTHPVTPCFIVSSQKTPCTCAFLSLLAGKACYRRTLCLASEREQCVYSLRSQQ